MEPPKPPQPTAILTLEEEIAHLQAKAFELKSEIKELKNGIMSTLWLEPEQSKGLAKLIPIVIGTIQFILLVLIYFKK